MSNERTFKIKGVNHIGLAPKDPVKARWFFETALGLPSLGEELVSSQETMTFMISSFTDKDAGPQLSHDRLEILVPQDGDKGPIAKFLEKKGSGIHHVALSVDDVAAAIAHLRAQGVRMIDETPRSGAHHTRIAFVHPESTGGVLVELVEEAK